MAQRVRDLMAANPIEMDARTTVHEAPRRMRDADIGDVLVMENGTLCGIVTDREDLAGCTLGDVCSKPLVSVGPDEDADAAIMRMREKAIRRIAVVEDGRPGCSPSATPPWRRTRVRHWPTSARRPRTPDSGQETDGRFPGSAVLSGARRLGVPRLERRAASGKAPPCQGAVASTECHACAVSASSPTI